MTRVLLAGVSVRAFAESAVRAGARVTAVDAFGDRDLEAIADTHPLPTTAVAGWSARAAARAARALPADAVAYGSSFENDPRAVALLSRNRLLLGNPPAVLARVRDPMTLARAARAAGFAAPRVRRRAPTPRDARWLTKPRRSGGGHGIHQWRFGAPLAPGMVLQEYVSGVSGSLVFIANGTRAVPLALTRQLVGEAAFGARGMTYCGNILVPPGDPALACEAKLLAHATRLASWLVRAFGLVGANGFDFIAREGVPWLIEVNPRYTAAMELAERAYGLSVFDAHVRGVAGALPSFDVVRARRSGGAWGKAVLYARRTVRVGDTTSWLADPRVRDIPASAQRIERGRPICTIFARASSVRACHAALVRRAQALYSELEHGRRRIA